MRSGLDAHCVAVDTWKGDEHAGHYGENVFQEFRAFHDQQYAAFSTLLRASFDDAVGQFEDGSIDLLHIDGLHTYEAVSHDFATWLPKMGNDGIVLLHDIAVIGRGFGVHRFWDELRERYPSFAFAHSFGLGVVAVGTHVREPVAALCGLSGAAAERARERFARLGELHEVRSALAIAVTLMQPPPAQEPRPAEPEPQEPQDQEAAQLAPAPMEPVAATRIDASEGISVVALPDAAEPVRGLEDIWVSVAALLRHMEQFNRNEQTLYDQQLGTIRDGCFLLPSVFDNAQADTCLQSYYVPHRFYYRFTGPEEYFWITGPLDSAYALSTVYFPDRHVAVTLRPGDISDSELLEFALLRAEVSKPAPEPVPNAGKRLVVTGFPHFTHALWNELPALERIATAGLGERMTIAAAYEPYGPILELLPELDCEVAPFTRDQTAELNRQNRLIVGLGSLRITQSILERVREVALRYTDAAVIAERDRFRTAHGPIFWLSVKPPPRTLLRQSEVLAGLIVLIRQRYPAAGFILDGTSRPWDAATNPNYAGWFSDELAEASRLSAAEIEAVLEELEPELRETVRVVSDVSVCEEIAWGAIADFYFCHFGTMQNKIGWTHPVPGMIHTGGPFRDAFDPITRVVENGPPCYLIPAHLVEDLEPEAEAVLDGERDEGNYRFTSIEDVALEILAAFEISLEDAREAPKEREQAAVVEDEGLPDVTRHVE